MSSSSSAAPPLAEGITVKFNGEELGCVKSVRVRYPEYAIKAVQMAGYGWYHFRVPKSPGEITVEVYGTGNVESGDTGELQIDDEVFWGQVVRGREVNYQPGEPITTTYTFQDRWSEEV